MVVVVVWGGGGGQEEGVSWFSAVELKYPGQPLALLTIFLLSLSLCLSDITAPARFLTEFKLQSL